jgi:hypothetical protein
MNRILFFFLLVVSLGTSCIPFQTLNSTTYIKPNDSFILGNNVHGRFSVRVTNTSVTPITLWQCPIEGGKHSPKTLEPAATVKVKVDKNTALKIENDTQEQVAVKLKVHGATNLSMEYEK